MPGAHHEPISCPLADIPVRSNRTDDRWSVKCTQSDVCQTCDMLVQYTKNVASASFSETTAGSAHAIGAVPSRKSALVGGGVTAASGVLRASDMEPASLAAVASRGRPESRSASASDVAS